MKKRKRIILYITGGAIGLTGAILLVSAILNRQISAEIPELPGSMILTRPVQEQIAGAMRNAKRKPSADNLGRLGMVYHSSANYEQAARCYRLAIRKGKTQWVWNYYLGYLNMEMGQSEGVIANFSQVIEKKPEIDLAWYYLGTAYKNLGQNQQAEASFDRITLPQTGDRSLSGTARIDHFPLTVYAMYQLARIYFDSGRLDLAEQTLNKIIQDHPSYGPAYRMLGNLYREEGDIELSSRFGVRANDLVAFSPPVDTLVDRLVLLSRSELFLLKKIDEAQRNIYSQWALTMVDNALHYLPDNKYVISKAISICLWTGLEERARTFVDRHIGLFEEEALEMKKTGMAFFLNGLYPQAIEYYSRALKLEPEETEIQKNLALCYHFTGDRKRAIEILDALAGKHAGDPDIMAEVANVLFFNLREGEKAMDYLSGLDQLAPSNPKVQKLHAGIAEKDGKVREAISMYQSSFRGNPADLTTIKYLGNLLFEQEMWERTISHYREALEHHPNDPYFLERMGTLLVACPDSSLRDIEEGKAYSERAFVHKLSRPGTLVSSGRSLAYAHAALGDLSDAIDIISQAINIGRREQIAPSYLEELESLYETFRSMGP